MWVFMINIWPPEVTVNPQQACQNKGPVTGR